VYDNRNVPGPGVYQPDKPLGNRSGSPQYTIGKRLPGKIQALEKQSFLPSPFQYSVKTDIVAPSRYKKIGFGYGIKSGGASNKLGPGPGDYNLQSFTDKFRPSLYIQTRKSQKSKMSHSLIPSPRDCSMTKPMTGGHFDPNGVIKKEKSPGFNYPPIKLSKFARAGNTMFYKSDGFRAKMSQSMQKSHSPVGELRKSQPNKPAAMKESGSDSNSISNK
jgi:hypothetical protein